MLLTSWLISMACASIQTYANHQDACDKFLQMGSQKVGLADVDGQVENYYEVKATDTATQNFGNSVVEVVGGTGYAYKSYRHKSIDFKLPTIGVADKVTMHLDQNSGSLGFNWKMPWLK